MRIDFPQDMAGSGKDHRPDFTVPDSLYACCPEVPEFERFPQGILVGHGGILPLSFIVREKSGYSSKNRTAYSFWSPLQYLHKVYWEYRDCTVCCFEKSVPADLSGSGGQPVPGYCDGGTAAQLPRRADSHPSAGRLPWGTAPPAFRSLSVCSAGSSRYPAV